MPAQPAPAWLRLAEETESMHHSPSRRRVLNLRRHCLRTASVCARVTLRQASPRKPTTGAPRCFEQIVS